MKRCPRCNMEKEFKEFNKDKNNSDGLYGYCRECVKKRSIYYREKDREKNKKYAEEYRKKNREFLRQKAKETFWRDHEKRLQQGAKSYHKHKNEIAKRRKIKRITPEGRKKEAQRQRKWREKNKEKYINHVRKWQKTNKIKHNAHQMVHRAVERGFLIRKEYCERCNMKCKTEGHHEDYKKPLEVIWLCRLCHASEIEIIEV